MRITSYVLTHDFHLFGRNRFLQLKTGCVRAKWASIELVKVEIAFELESTKEKQSFLRSALTA